MLQSEFVTTAQEFQNFRTVREMGIAHGIVVRSRSVVGSFFGGIQQLFGGNITIYTHLCEQARAEAFDKMMANAASLGANAVVGFRFESTELGQGLSEVLAYGTAVIIEAKR